jgi:capsular polysaccharide transport system permease protein
MINAGALARINMFLDGLAAEGSVLRALVVRELQFRFGRDNIGYLWVIGEPLLLASVITSLHSVAEIGHDSSGVSAYTFTLTGYCLFIIFRGTFNRAESIIRSSETLLYHSMIKPLDIILSKAIVETIGAISALAILQIVGIMIGAADLPARPLYLFGATFLIAWWTFALALIIAAYTYEGHVLGRLVHPISYFAMPLSGAFITMTFLPSWARPIMAWNPMMTMFEIARYGQFWSASPNYMYGGYVVAICAGLTYWGLIAIRQLRAKIHVP